MTGLAVAFGEISIVATFVVFALAGIVILAAGVRMAGVADRLADITRVGEAVTGAVLLGASTSLPGIVVSVTAAAQDHPQLAVSNAVGGIAAQTFFLALADMAYRKANLEHAAASVPNLMYGSLLIVLLALPLLAFAAPEVSVFQVHPLTLVLFVVYLFGVRLIGESRDQPMWGPKITTETRVDRASETRRDARTITQTVLLFGVLATLVGTAGYIVAGAGIAIVEKLDLGEAVVGALMTAIVTSLPELVTTIAAVRRGALTLAVGGILGGNGFDVLFLAAADVSYRGGSIYHTIAPSQLFLIVLSILMTAILIAGLMRRERFGIANIGLESVLLLVLYLGGLFVLVDIG